MEVRRTTRQKQAQYLRDYNRLKPVQQSFVNGYIAHALEQMQESKGKEKEEK